MRQYEDTDDPQIESSFTPTVMVSFEIIKFTDGSQYKR